MNKAALLLLLVMAVSFVNSHALGKFFLDEPLRRGETEIAYVTIRNRFNVELEDVDVKFHIYDLGLWYSSMPGDVEDRDHVIQTVFLDIPRDVKPGLYLTKITVGNDRFRDTQHVYLRIV